MLGQDWEEHDELIHKIITINYEEGEMRYSSSDCSSYVGSPNGTTYAAHSPTFSYATTDQLFTHLPADHFQGVQHNDECPNSIIESMNRATPYSPEEKKERIERYRSKRNLRNFNKKIKYECRKTLADSRPRVRGRFAKNEEAAARPPHQTQWEYNNININDDYNWIAILDAFSTNFMP